MGTIMKARYVLAVLMMLAVLIAGCKKEEPGPASREPATSGPAREYPAAGQSPAEGPNAVAPTVAIGEDTPRAEPLEQKEYFAVFMEGKKIGHAVQTRLEADGQVTTSEQVRLTVSRAGVAVTIDMTETSIETTEGEPLGFEVKQQLGAMLMNIKGTIDEQGKVTITTSSMGTEQSTTMAWPAGAVMAEGLRLLSEEKGMEEGTEYSVKIFSPGVTQAIDAQVRIGAKHDIDLLGRVVPLTEVVTTMEMPGAGTIATTAYVDDEGRTQRSLVPVAGMNIEMVACAKEFALGENDVFEVIDRLFVKSPEPLGNADSAAQITYVLSPTDEETFNIPATDNQSVERGADGTVTVTVRPVRPPTGATFPYEGDDIELLEALKPNRFLQSDDKKVIELARGAVGRSKDTAEALKRIEAFVAEYIENKDLSVGYASAAEVVASRQGDCSEHAVLAAAMCRAVGIPARIVTGIAYVDDWRGMQGFGGHAWVEAYIGDRNGKWVGLDAAFRGTGRGGYGPGHITLAVGNGEPADFLNLATTLGKFKIDRVTVTR